MKHFKYQGNYILYFAIASLQVLVVWPDPLSWRAWVSALLAGLIALKAKKSSNTEHGDNPHV